MDTRSHIKNLSPQKKKYLELWKKGNREHKISEEEYPPRPQQDLFPLSFTQERLWFLEQLETGSTFHNVSDGLRLEGTLNLYALRESFNLLIARHEALNTSFEANENNQPMQRIHPPVPICMVMTDLSDLPATEQQELVQTLSTQHAIHPFDLRQAPLLHLHLLRLHSHDHLLLLTLHHIIIDGWSLSLLYRELNTLYTSLLLHTPPALPTLPLQYADFARWQRQHVQGPRLLALLSFWRLHLQGAPALLDLPTDAPRPPQPSFAGATVRRPVPASVVSGLLRLSQEQGATLFMGGLAILAILLGRWSGQEDLVIGTPIAGRNRPELEGVIGCFVNLLALRLQPVATWSFRRFLQQVRQVCLQAYEHQELPFEKLVEELHPQRSLSHTPLFQVVFTIKTADQEMLSLPKVTTRRIVSSTPTTKFDLGVGLLDHGNNTLAVVLEYNTDLFQHEAIERMAQQYCILLEQVVIQPDIPIGRVSLLSQDDRTQLLHLWSETTLPPPVDCIHTLFERQVRGTPLAIALSCEDQLLTYQDLEIRANRLAHHLRSLGVGPEICVGLLLERSPELVIAVLAILKAGGAYLPLDPALPTERMAFMLADTQARLIITQEALYERPHGLLDNHQAFIIDDTTISMVSYPTEPPVSAVQPQNLAYVIYTSGSTGTPKGVMIPHANVVRLLCATADEFRFDATDIWTLFHSIAFDFSVWELWGALLYGGQLVIVPYWVSRSPEQIWPIASAVRLSPCGKKNK